MTILKTPKDGASLTAAELILSWRAARSEGAEVVTYEIEVSTSPDDFSSPVTGLADTLGLRSFVPPE